jgi:hypothetical protein
VRKIKEVRTSAGAESRAWCCARNTKPASSCSWIGRELPSPSTTEAVVPCSRRIYSLLCWEQAPRPTLKPLPTSSWRTGSARTCGLLGFIRAFRVWHRIYVRVVMVTGWPSPYIALDPTKPI